MRVGPFQELAPLPAAEPAVGIHRVPRRRWFEWRRPSGWRAEAAMTMAANRDHRLVSCGYPLSASTSAIPGAWRPPHLLGGRTSVSTKVVVSPALASAPSRPRWRLCPGRPHARRCAPDACGRILASFASGSCGWVQSSFEPFFLRVRSKRANSARVGVERPGLGQPGQKCVVALEAVSRRTMLRSPHWRGDPSWHRCRPGAPPPDVASASRAQHPRTAWWVRGQQATGGATASSGPAGPRGGRRPRLQRVGRRPCDRSSAGQSSRATAAGNTGPAPDSAGRPRPRHAHCASTNASNPASSSTRFSRS